MNTLAGESTVSASRTAPQRVRFSDLELAQAWADTCGLYFSVTHEQPAHGEFYEHRHSSRFYYLRELEVSSRILQFLQEMVEGGALIRINPARIKNVRALAAMLMLKEDKR